MERLLSKNYRNLILLLVVDKCTILKDFVRKSKGLFIFIPSYKQFGKEKDKYNDDCFE